MPSLADLQFVNNRRPLSSLSQTTPMASYLADPEVITDEAQMGLEVVTDRQVSDVGVDKLTTAIITSQQITLAVRDGAGDVFLNAGKTDFSTSGTGFILGIDDSDNNRVKFYLGDASNYLYWTPTDGLVISGSLVAGEIHIPDRDTTDNSFHTDSNGNSWWGATETDFTASNDNAKAYILSTGEALFQDVRVRGSIYGATFQYDVISAVGGQLLVTNADVLDSDMTAADASTMTIRGDTTFANDDILHIKAVTSSGIQEEWFRVTDNSAAPTYTVTRDLASAYAADSNPAWPAGTTVVKEGSSDLSSTFSGGWLRLIGEGSNGPHYSVFDRTGVAYNAYTEVARFGNLNGIAGETTEVYGIFIGDYDSGNGQYFKYADGTLEVNGSQLTNEALFGDGSDGDVTISSGTTTLTSDMYYNNLTIESGATLKPNGYRVFVRNKLDLQSGGTIEGNGNDGTSGTDGTDGVAAIPVGGTAGTPGSGGSALSDGSLPGGLAGVDGSASGNGGSDIASGTGIGGSGTAGTSGSDVDKPMVDTAVAGVAGADGGNGGAGVGGSAGAAGSAGTDTDTIINGFKVYTAAYLLFDPQDQKNYATSPQNGGTGGSGGGGADANGDSGVRGAGGGGGGAGGGGGNARTLQIFARILVLDGTITANGGDGGDGGNGGDGQWYVTGGAGGGGGAGSGGSGGNGGVVILVYSRKTGSGTATANGGAGGTAGTPGLGDGSGGSFTAQDGDAGNDGNAGTDGEVIELQV